MKWLIVVGAILITVIGATGKSTDKKSVPKKVISTKQTKTSKSLIDEFKGLPADDLKFIKDLDKQYKLHGNNVKIKIEKDNSTNNKNTKRTIDGNLGYGYNNHVAVNEGGYHFSQPKFMIYPYSQEDIPPSENQHYYNSQSTQNIAQYAPYQHPQQQTLHTSVQIQPSRAYEIKEIPDEGQTQQQSYPQYDALPNYHDNGPVIVLRIPGPQKYASHLQKLLQEYLEIRAAQYITQLKQSEEAHTSGYNYNQESPAAYVQGQQAVDDVAPQIYQENIGHTYEQPQVSDVVYQSQDNVDYHSQNGNEEIKYEYQQQKHNLYPPSVPNHYYQTAQHAVYGPPTHITEDSLPIYENYPRHTHTQVFFPNTNYGKRSQLGIHIPVRNIPYHSNNVYHHESLVQHSQPTPLTESSASQYYSESDKVYGSPSEKNVVAITQRSPSKVYSTIQGISVQPTKSNKRQAPFSEEQFKKFNKLISQLKKKSSTRSLKANK